MNVAVERSTRFQTLYLNYSSFITHEMTNEKCQMTNGKFLSSWLRRLVLPFCFLPPRLLSPAAVFAVVLGVLRCVFTGMPFVL